MPVMKAGPGRALLYSGVVVWDPSQPTTDGDLLPDHWYRSDGPLWQDAGVTPAVLDGAVVGRWEDLTANADHVNQAVVANKPTRQTVPGVGTVVRFDGTNDFLQGAFTAGGALTQPFTVFAVAALDAVAVNDGSNHLISDSDDVVSRLIAGANASTTPDKWYVYAGVVRVGNASNSNWNIWTIRHWGVLSRFWHNGIIEVSADAGVQNADGLTIGAAFDGTALWDGDIAEYIIYDSDLSDADKNQVGNYLVAGRATLSYADI